MGGVRKPLLEIHGRPVLAWALQPFLDHPDVTQVVVALPAGLAADPPVWLSAHPVVTLVEGGASRTASVGTALNALGPDVRRVIVHDGARPIVRREWIDTCLAAASEGFGAVIGYPAVDTIKEVSDDGRVTGTPDRSRLWQVQTPQAFPRELLDQAYAQVAPLGAASDDAALVEKVGGVVRLVLGGTENVKITHPGDVVRAEVLLSPPQ